MSRSILLRRSPRDTRVARVSTLGAVALTGLAFGTVIAAMMRRPGMLAPTPAPPAWAIDERIVFSAPVPAVVRPAVAITPTVRDVPRELQPSAVVAPEPTTRLDTGLVTSFTPGEDPPPRGIAGDVLAETSAAARSAPSTSPVFIGPLGLRRPAPPSAAERVTAVRALNLAVPAMGRVRRATPAERDSLARDEAYRFLAARDAHRPAPMAAGGGFAVGLPGGGPTRAQRVRDSTLHQGNLTRLRAIAERAQPDSGRSEVVP